VLPRAGKRRPTYCGWSLNCRSPRTRRQPQRSWTSNRARDRFNDALYRLAMHARHAIGDAKSVDTLLNALARALAEMDTEPADATIQSRISYGTAERPSSVGGE
jgi:hypothetical protein